MDPMLNADLKKKLIRAQPVFSLLTDQELDELSPLFVEKKYAPGETIVVEGELVDSIYLIISGEADVRHVFIEDGATKIQSVAKLRPGEAIGLTETGFYSLSGVRTATVVALQDVVLLRLSMAAFHGFALMNAHVNEVMRSYARNVIIKS